MFYAQSTSTVITGREKLRDRKRKIARRKRKKEEKRRKRRGGGGGEKKREKKEGKRNQMAALRFQTRGWKGDSYDILEIPNRGVSQTCPASFLGIPNGGLSSRLKNTLQPPYFAIPPSPLLRHRTSLDNLFSTPYHHTVYTGTKRNTIEYDRLRTNK